MRNKILVIGDVGEDIWRIGSCNRLNPESASLILDVEDYSTGRSMAGNIFSWVKTLYSRFHPFFGKFEVWMELSETNISKIRYVDGKSWKTLLRVDFGESTSQEYRSGEYLSDVFNLIKKENIKYVIVGDYNKNAFSFEDLRRVGDFCSKNGVTTFLDTKKIFDEPSYFNQFDFIKVNYLENKKNPLFEKYNNNLIITNGPNPSKLYQGSEFVFESKLLSYEPNIVDCCGAGDAFIAAFAMAYIDSNKDLKISLDFAQMVASLSVEKKGTGKCINFSWLNSQYKNEN